MPCGILALSLGIKLMPTALVGWRVNHWTTREVAQRSFKLGSDTMIFLEWTVG